MATAAAAAAGASQWVKGNVADNGLAILTLDRPKALNAMNLEMDIIYKSYLDEWASQAAVKCVLVESSTSRAFCAGGVLSLQFGGDIKQMHNRGKEQKMLDVAIQVFGAEYSLICAIARYQKPYISLMDGITMGFGIGLSGHGRYRVVTERTILAMPENAIGLFPDVGFSHLVAESPGNGTLGAYLALTGTRITNPADALYAGLATHYVPSQNLAVLRDELVQSNLSSDADEKVEALLSKYGKNPEGESKFKHLLGSIMSCFADCFAVVEMVDALEEEKQSSDPAVAEWAKEALEGLNKGAPFSLYVTQQHYQAVASAHSGPPFYPMEIEDVLRSEYCLGINLSMRSDFVEGVRAVVIDKDQKPRWDPVEIGRVDFQKVEESFQLEGDYPRPPF